MADQDLDCNELVELVTDYLEDALPSSERARLDAHLVGCRGCRAYLDQMRLTVQAVGHLPEESIVPAAQQDLLRVFRAWKSGAEPPASTP